MVFSKKFKLLMEFQTGSQPGIIGVESPVVVSHDIVVSKTNVFFRQEIALYNKVETKV